MQKLAKMLSGAAVATAATFMLAPSASAETAPGQTCPSTGTMQSQAQPGGPTDADQHGRHVSGNHMGTGHGPGSMMKAQPFCQGQMH
jgi:hypothetical protein